MGIKFSPGFTVFKNGTGPAWVAIHAGPGFHISESRDEKTDVVAGLCQESLGGTLIVSNASRRKRMGIDYNRSPPPEREAIRMHTMLGGKDIDQEAYYRYRLKYAWTAADRKDHLQRLGIYQGFWREVDKSETVVMIHRMFTSPKTAGSAMDIFTKGFDGNAVKSAVGNSNKVHVDFLKRTLGEFSDYLLMEERRRISYVKRTPLEQMEKEFPRNVKGHMRILGAKTMDGVIPALEKSLVKAGPPAITIERIFDGSLSHGLSNLSGGKRIIQAEVTGFLCNWYPEKASEMICGILKALGSMDE